MGSCLHRPRPDGLGCTVGDANRAVGLAGGPALIGKTEMTVFAEDDVIQQGDAKKFRALAKSLREHAIFLAGRWITGRMVMGTDNAAAFIRITA